MLSLTECSSQLHELVGAQPRKRDRQHSTVSAGNYFYTELQSNLLDCESETIYKEKQRKFTSPGFSTSSIRDEIIRHFGRNYPVQCIVRTENLLIFFHKSKLFQKLQTHLQF